jgi:hypothetical protein
LDGIFEECLGLFVHFTSQVDQSDVVEQVGNVLVLALVVTLDCLLEELERVGVGFLDGVAGAKVVHALGLLARGLLGCSPALVVLDGLVVVLEVEVAVAEVEGQAAVLLLGLAQRIGVEFLSEPLKFLQFVAELQLPGGQRVDQPVVLPRVRECASGVPQLA